MREPGPSRHQVEPYGLRMHQDGEGSMSAELAVEDELRRPDGAIHAGAYAAVAESLALAGTRKRIAAGASAELLTCHLNRLTALGGDRLLARACARHRGRTTWVWEVECSDEAGRVLAVARVTVSVRPAAP